jgi:hypothetical protein
MGTSKLRHAVMVIMIYSLLGFCNADSQSLPQDKTCGEMRRPLYFIPNQGQFHEEVAYCAKAAGYTLWIKEHDITYDTSTLKNSSKTANLNSGFSPIEYTRKVCRTSFSGANGSFRIIPHGITDHRVNFFIGNERSAWRTGIPTYRSILFQDLYPRIDLKVYGMDNMNIYEFIIYPGGDISNIEFTYEGCATGTLNNEGNLILKSGPYEFRHKDPLCLLISEKIKTPVEVQFQQKGADSLGYTVGDYDKRTTLVIQQKVSVSAPEKDCGFFNRGYEIAVDSSGAAYVTGQISPIDFPSRNFHRSTFTGKDDVFVAKLNTSGTALIYSTYIGGAAFDYGKGIQVDSNGNAYVTGITSSDDFPTKKALFSSSAGGFDAFIVKINASGSELVYSTYLGGSSDDSGQSLTVDSSGAVGVTGWTQSHDFPVKNALIDRLSGNMDAFVAKIDSSGSVFHFSTYLGGDSMDFAKDIAASISGTIWVTGYTGSGDYPIANALFPALSGKLDAFVTQLSETGTEIVFSTFLGGNSYDIGNAISVDSTGNVYITGYTNSKDFPVKNALDDTLSGRADAFVAKISLSDTSLVYSTFLGGTSDDSGCDIAVDAELAAYITGYTDSIDFPFQKSRNEILLGDRDAYVTKINPAGSAISYSMFLGGASCDSGKGIAVDRSGSAYVTGYTKSTDFPTKKAFCEIRSGKDDAFVAKCNASGSALVYSTYLGGLRGFPLF